jgi:hypothetical protein
MNMFAKAHASEGLPPPPMAAAAAPTPKAVPPPSTTTPIPAPQPSTPEEQARLDELRAMSKGDRNAKYNMFKRAMVTTTPSRKPPASIVEAWKAACSAPGPCECIPARKVGIQESTHDLRAVFDVLLECVSIMCRAGRIPCITITTPLCILSILPSVSGTTHEDAFRRHTCSSNL